MTKLYKEVQFAGGSKGRFRMPRHCYTRAEQRHRDELARDMPGPDADAAALKTLDPSVLAGMLDKPDWADGVIARLPWGTHPELANPMTYDAPARMAFAGQLPWLDAFAAEVRRQHDRGNTVLIYNGKQGVGSLDALSSTMIDRLPATHIIDSVNTRKEASWWDQLGEPFPTDPDAAKWSAGAYCRISNLWKDGWQDRLNNAMRLVASFNEGTGNLYTAIAASHNADETRWLLGSSLAVGLLGRPKATAPPNWKTLIEGGISLSFRNTDADDLDAELGGRLAELREVAG